MGLESLFLSFQNAIYGCNGKWARKFNWTVFTWPMVFMVAHVLWEISFFDWKKLKEEEIFNSSRPPPPLHNFHCRQTGIPPHHLMGEKKNLVCGGRSFYLCAWASTKPLRPTVEFLKWENDWSDLHFFGAGDLYTMPIRSKPRRVRC